jgi:hypothetical protein
MFVRWMLALSLGSSAGSVLVACIGSGDDNASAVPVPDASRGADAADAADATVHPDGCVPDGGPAAKCNSCATPATNPLNACSTYTGTCIPFDAARVPDHAAL